MSPEAGRVITGHAGLFLPFFYRLRGRGLAVTPSQWLTLVEALSQGLHGSSLTGFYLVARSVLVRDESELDEFDLVFASHFQGAGEELVTAIEKEVLAWLESPVPPYPIDPRWQQVLDAVDVDALREQLEQRLREQQERHDGGSHWIGTGGTSPFGHSGHHPGGIRVGGEGGGGTAVQVAGERHYRELRRDLVLDTRQLGLALKRLRSLEREGPAEELDLDGTIDQTARAGGELELVLKPPRHNRLSLLLAIDVGGSMEPFRHLVSLLFSAAHSARHLKRLDHLYFHNCVYEQLYTDASFRESITLPELLRRHDRQTRLVLVGDAYMYPGELTQPHGSIDWTERNEQPGVVYLQRLQRHFQHTAWLNPIVESAWRAPSIHIVRSIFPMYPLTIEGVSRLSKDLARS